MASRQYYWRQRQLNDELGIARSVLCAERGITRSAGRARDAVAFRRVLKCGRVLSGDSGDRGVRRLGVLPAHLVERRHNRGAFW